AGLQTGVLLVPATAFSGRPHPFDPPPNPRHLCVLCIPDEFPGRLVHPVRSCGTGRERSPVAQPLLAVPLTCSCSAGLSPDLWGSRRIAAPVRGARSIRSPG